MEPGYLREPAVAGFFYPADPAELASTVDQALADAGPGDQRIAVKAVIAPHAGYQYSGPTAATAYRAFDVIRDDVHAVVIVGPSHRHSVSGIAVSGASAFATPLGDARVDIASRNRVLALPGVEAIEAAHVAEHSVEVHIPFVQRYFGDVAILPMVVGASHAQETADVLRAVWDEPGTVIVVSSDLSHYHDYVTANRLDAATAAKIVAGDYEKLVDADACGASPIRGLLAAVANTPLSITCLKLCNSGNTAGDRHRVVGYGAFSIGEAR